MPERGVADVLHVEDDPGYALMVRKSLARSAAAAAFTPSRTAGRPCGSSAGPVGFHVLEPHTPRAVEPWSVRSCFCDDPPPTVQLVPVGSRPRFSVSARMVVSLGRDRLPRGGVMDHGSLGDTSPPRARNTYPRQQTRRLRGCTEAGCCTTPECGRVNDVHNKNLHRSLHRPFH